MCIFLYFYIKFFVFFSYYYPYSKVEGQTSFVYIDWNLIITWSWIYFVRLFVLLERGGYLWVSFESLKENYLFFIKSVINRSKQLSMFKYILNNYDRLMWRNVRNRGIELTSWMINFIDYSMIIIVVVRKKRNEVDWLIVCFLH